MFKLLTNLYICKQPFLTYHKLIYPPRNLSFFKHLKLNTNLNKSIPLHLY